MTHISTRENLLAMANEHEIKPWSAYYDLYSGTIRFKGCTFFFLNSSIMVWRVDRPDPMEIVDYCDIREEHWKHWEAMLVKLEEV